MSNVVAFDGSRFLIVIVWEAEAPCLTEFIVGETVTVKLDGMMAVIVLLPKELFKSGKEDIKIDPSSSGFVSVLKMPSMFVSHFILPQYSSSKITVPLTGTLGNSIF